MYKFSLKKLTDEQKKLRIKILELSHESNLSHLGSCLSSVDLIDAIYKTKKKNEKFVLSNGHAGIAWYVVLEKYGYIKDSKTIKKLNIHPDRNIKYDIHVSTGSLGQGLPIALGMALADRKKNVYCMISDGECTEGSIWEALRVASEKKVHNLKIILNANGWSAYDKVNLSNLANRFKGFGYTIKKVDGHDSKQILSSLKNIADNKSVILFAYTSVEQFPFLKGQDAHYYVLKDEDYKEGIRALI
jgi:transketolase